MKEPHNKPLHWASPDTYLLGENDRTDAVKYEYVNGQAYAIKTETVNCYRIDSKLKTSVNWRYSCKLHSYAPMR